MKANRHLIFYIFLNITISALTMLAVLWIWNRVQQSHVAPSFYRQRDDCPPCDVSQSALPSNSEALIQIKNVYGVGNIDTEVVVIERNASDTLDLNGWQMVDENGNRYTFPRLSFTKGEINIHTRPGINTPKDLYWELPYAVWSTGEKVKILDAAGNERASYVIP
ncbi:MAG: lamin tail domain-containing protein [Anaerolineae bacterium]|nr:lamin tail domain-containing protein [Anaerolineae bacterium]